ncbi:MAG: Stp1/IreP family PP2C-type Ser/Thr phosphatase [Polyangiaceae bacterium]
MRPVAAGLTDVGKERDHNEDRFVLLPQYDVFVVADGMGGHQCGEVASRLATSTIANYFRVRDAGDAAAERIPDVLRAALLEANEQIHRRANNSAKHRGMGTTVVAAAVNCKQSKLYVAHAGDSRCYRLRGDELAQLTRDHSLVEEALRTRPDMSESELSYLPGNVITRALGVEPAVDVEVTTDRIQLGDLYLLCSDGLHGFVSDERIAAILGDEAVLTKACAALIDEANENGGGDNITAVVVRIDETDGPWRVSTTVPPPPGRAPEPENDDVEDPDSTVQTSAITHPDEVLADTQRLSAVTDPEAVLRHGSGSDDVSPHDTERAPESGPPDDDDDED